MGFNNYMPEKNLFADSIIKWIADIVTILTASFFLGIYLGDYTYVTGNSMSPVVKGGEVVLIDKISYSLRQPQRFDVIVFRDQTDPDRLYVKRIIGLPGEKVQIKDSVIYITDADGNESKLDDKYCIADKYEGGQAAESVTVHDGEYFVMGDNRNLSGDSRFPYVGNIKRDNIMGRAWFRSSPFSRMGIIR